MEKKQQSPLSSNTQADKQYLEKSKVNGHMKDMVAKFIENKPENAVDFFAEYYEKAVGPRTDKITRALYYINLNHFNNPAFNFNIQHAYESLTQSKEHLKVLKGLVYMDLLRALCKDFPDKTRKAILLKLHIRDYEIVSYEMFKSCLLICLVTREYILTAEGLFRLLIGQPRNQSDISKNIEKSKDVPLEGKADSSVAGILIDKLKDAIKISSNSTSSVQLLEACESLSPSAVHSSLSSSVSEKPSKMSLISKEDFINKICLLLLDRVCAYYSLKPFQSQSGYLAYEGSRRALKVELIEENRKILERNSIELQIEFNLVIKEWGFLLGSLDCPSLWDCLAINSKTLGELNN